MMCSTINSSNFHILCFESNVTQTTIAPTVAKKTTKTTTMTKSFDTSNNNNFNCTFSIRPLGIHQLRCCPGMILPLPSPTFPKSPNSSPPPK